MWASSGPIILSTLNALTTFLLCGTTDASPHQPVRFLKMASAFTELGTRQGCAVECSPAGSLQDQ